MWLLPCIALLGFGSGCRGIVEQYLVARPRILPETATLDQVVEVVNQNSQAVNSLYSPRATISSPGMPGLSAQIAMERPRRFRLEATTRLTGAELDLGSNDELFWFWVRRNHPPALYYCDHEAFATSAAREAIPIEPDWLIEALGVTEFSPDAQHHGPFPVGRRRLEVQSILATARGPVTKVTRVDAASGWVVEQHLYDPRNRLVASALASEHQQDPLTGVVLPRVVDLQWPDAQLSLKIRLHDLQVNSLGEEMAQLWNMPQISGTPLVNLADPRLEIPGPVTHPTELVPVPAGPPPVGAPQGVLVQKQESHWWDTILRR
jgi:hypothetical protein